MRITRPGFGMDRDSIMTSYKWLNPGTVDALDMDNGLVSPYAELRGPVYWGTPHSTPQGWVNRVLLCYARGVVQP